MNPFSERKNRLRALQRVIRSDIPPEVLARDNELLECKNCKAHVTRGDLRNANYVCPSCGYHSKLSARGRIRITADEDSFREISRSLMGHDPLKFPGYDEKIAAERKKTGMREAVITGTCRIKGIKVVMCIMDSRFMMASMGMAVGEKITRAAEYATRHRLPLVIFSASGGARMQEGILSLMQMAKTSAAIARHSEAGLLYISVLTNPTTGGVTASFASLGDIILAEPGALIGFAGPRVIEQTINEKLPEGFQSAEFQLDHGFVDAVVHRSEMKDKIALLLKLHANRR